MTGIYTTIGMLVFWLLPTAALAALLHEAVRAIWQAVRMARYILHEDRMLLVEPDRTGPALPVRLFFSLLRNEFLARPYSTRRLGRREFHYIPWTERSAIARRNLEMRKRWAEIDAAAAAVRHTPTPPEGNPER